MLECAPLICWRLFCFLSSLKPLSRKYFLSSNHARPSQIEFDEDIIYFVTSTIKHSQQLAAPPSLLQALSQISHFICHSPMWISLIHSSWAAELKPCLSLISLRLAGKPCIVYPECCTGGLSRGEVKRAMHEQPRGCSPDRNGLRPLGVSQNVSPSFEEIIGCYFPKDEMYSAQRHHKTQSSQLSHGCFHCCSGMAAAYLE